MPIITRVLELSLASAPPGARILRVNLRVGSLCDADPLWLERYFRVAARGTAAEGAVLGVRRDGGPPGEAPAGEDPIPEFGYVLESIEVPDEPEGTPR